MLVELCRDQDSNLGFLGHDEGYWPLYDHGHSVSCGSGSPHWQQYIQSKWFYDLHKKHAIFFKNHRLALQFTEDEI